MPRYINEDEFIAWVKEHFCSDCNNDNGLRCRACWVDDAIDLVEDAPKADVVPKSELDNLEYTLIGVMHSVDKWLEGDELKQHEVNRAATMREKTMQIVEGLQKTISVYEETSGLKQAKREVAREIFEDLEMYVEEHNGCSVNLSRCEFAELKKKYTEDQT